MTDFLKPIDTKEIVADNDNVSVIPMPCKSCTFKTKSLLAMDKERLIVLTFAFK